MSLLIPRVKEDAFFVPYWYAVYTRPRHEKQVNIRFEERKIECFLPLRETIRQWKDRRKKVKLPLFNGYIFVKIPLKDRIKVLEVDGVVRLVGFKSEPSPIPDDQIDAVKAFISNSRDLFPVPYLKVGQRVKVINGPLRGVEGILIKKQNQFRLIISIDLIMQSVAVNIDARDVIPVSSTSSIIY